MGLFDRIKSLFAPRMPEIGITDPVCPYCALRLHKMPARKTKCRGCGQYIFVRTRPTDEKRILIREDQDIQIEEQWAIANGTHSQFVAARMANEIERERLQKQFGREPSEGEIQWSRLNRSLSEHANLFDWGLYRNARLLMGDILKKEGRHLEALDTYLEVCYLDLNGPNNCGTRDPSILGEEPPFDPEDASLAPGVIRYIATILKREHLSATDAKTRFVEIATRAQRSLTLPVAPDKAWWSLAKEIS